MELQQKVMNAFIGKVVRKDLAFLVKGGLPVPTYVLEYLLGQYCASDDEEVINDGLEKVKQVIKNNYVHRAEAESVKGIIRENGKHRIIDKVTVILNEKSDAYNATFSNLGLSGVPIGTEYVRKNPKLLSGNGVWCIVTIGYISGEDVKVRWEIQNLKPIQELHHRRMARLHDAHCRLESRAHEPPRKVHYVGSLATSCGKQLQLHGTWSEGYR